MAALFWGVPGGVGFGDGCDFLIGEIGEIFEQQAAGDLVFGWDLNRLGIFGGGDGGGDEERFLAIRAAEGFSDGGFEDGDGLAAFAGDVHARTSDGGAFWFWRRGVRGGDNELVSAFFAECLFAYGAFGEFVFGSTGTFGDGHGGLSILVQL